MSNMYAVNSFQIVSCRGGVERSNMARRSRHPRYSHLIPLSEPRMCIVRELMPRVYSSSAQNNRIICNLLLLSYESFLEHAFNLA